MRLYLISCLTLTETDLPTKLKAMTFDGYMRAVIDYFMIGGVTWEQAYVRVLKEERPTLYNEIVNVEGYDPTRSNNLAAFLYEVFTAWNKR